MRLQIDEQTITDLKIFGKGDTPGLYDLYNETRTIGGEELLREMFYNPMNDIGLINHRSSMLGQFAAINIDFPYQIASFDSIDKYLMYSHQASAPTFGEKEIQNGVAAVLDILKTTFLLLKNSELSTVKAYAIEHDEIRLLLEDPVFEPARREEGNTKLSFAKITAFDTLFRVKEYEKIKSLLRYIFRLDVYISVAKVARKRGLVFPLAKEREACELNVEGLYHPELANPKCNDVSLGNGKSVMFLTGANMAGKSTFLRSIGTAVYIAHMGFPVAARSMTFSVLDGMYTTINLPDNLGIGASHFYAEVLRVKKIAMDLYENKALFVIFDELFRGTNVKDAHEGTVAIIDSFAKRTGSTFIISSHIVEAGEELKDNAQVLFQYLPTVMNGHTPTYTYTLKEGITADRHGMIIIENEEILKILKKSAKESQIIS